MLAGYEVFNGQGGLAITPHDTNNQGIFRSVYVGGTGNITLIGLDGNTVLFSSIPAGTILPVGFTRIKASGTTATLIVGIT